MASCSQLMTCWPQMGRSQSHVTSSNFGKTVVISRLVYAYSYVYIFRTPDIHVGGLTFYRDSAGMTYTFGDQ